MTGIHDCERAAAEAAASAGRQTEQSEESGEELGPTPPDSPVPSSTGAFPPVSGEEMAYGVWTLLEYSSPGGGLGTRRKMRLERALKHAESKSTVSEQRLFSSYYTRFLMRGCFND